MPLRRRTTVVALGLAGVTVGTGWLVVGRMDGPWGMVPGGPFEGPGVPCATAQWERLTAAREVQLEVRPERPRSVTTWSVVREGELFVPADFLTPWKRWPYQVLEDGRVRLRVRGEIFECFAERVGDAELIQQLRLAAAAKYDLEHDGAAANTEVWWFRLRPR